MCLRADLILTNAGQDGTVGTPKILKGSKKPQRSS